jgi:LysR family transcriptional regulator (chromosome initiation inhibitor)
MLDYVSLEALSQVVRQGSFERAARALHVTPSAVSQRIKLLEERLGLALVVRGTPCTATEAGHWLCRHMEQVGMLESELQGNLPALAALRSADQRVTLRVAVNADSLATWFINAAANFSQEAPALLDISVDDQDHTAQWLRDGTVLAAVTSDTQAIQGNRCVPLGRMRYVATASPAYVERHFAQGITAESLAKAPCLVFNRKDALQSQWAQNACGERVEMPQHWLPSSPGFVQACLVHMGWGMCPESDVQAHLNSGTLVRLLPNSDLMVPLAWQHARLKIPMLDRLTDAVVAAGRQVLES